MGYIFLDFIYCTCPYGLVQYVKSRKIYLILQEQPCYNQFYHTMSLIYKQFDWSSSYCTGCNICILHCSAIRDILHSSRPIKLLKSMTSCDNNYLLHEGRYLHSKSIVLRVQCDSAINMKRRVQIAKCRKLVFGLMFSFKSL